MKPSDLVTVWSAPDNSRVTAKQYSFRLPVRVAAQLAALEEMYPGRTRTQLVGDLMAAALVEVEEKLPYNAAEEQVSETNDGTPIYEAWGPRVEFRARANKHFAALEGELGNESPGELFAKLYAFGNDK